VCECVQLHKCRLELGLQVVGSSRAAGLRKGSKLRLEMRLGEKGLCGL
jgi:hypothetical protein